MSRSLVPCLHITRLLLLGSLIFPCGAKAASGGRLGLYSDVALSECTLADSSPRIADVYVVHSVTGSAAAFDGAISIMFQLGSSAGFTGTWLEDVLPAGMAAVGTSQSGIIIGYPCSHSSLVVLKIRYQMHGTSSSCSAVEAIPNAITWTCFYGDELPVDNGRLVVNSNQSCSCDMPVATESSTWGRVKAMYRN